MVSSFTPRNRLNKQAAGDNTNTWGDVLNSGVFDLTDFAMDGWAKLDPTGNVLLSTANGLADQARARVLQLNTAVASFTVTVPPVEKFYIVWNNTTATQTIACAGGGASATLRAGEVVPMVCDGVLVKRLSLLDLAGATLTNAGAPVNASDLATKQYADNLAFTANAGVLPGQAGNGGKFMTTDGTTPSWAALSLAVAQITDYAADQAARAATAQAASTALAVAFALAF